MNKIIENDFSRIDLNLLTVLMVLYREGSVTRTAEVLHLGQPAISGALKRLREMFDDPLFVRSARGMLPTPRAQALMTDLQPLMESLHSAMFGAGEFVPARAQQLFRIGLSDWSEHWLMPPLLPGLMQEAPGVSLQSIAADPFQVRQLLEEERIDVAVSVNKQSRGEIVSEPVMSMGVTTLWSPQQIPCRGPLSVNDFVAWEHVMVAYRETGHGEIDRQLASQGLARRVRFATQNFSTFPLLLTTLPLFATVPQGLAQRWQAQYALRADAPPVAYPEFTLCILRHKRRAQDPALNWLVTKLKQAMRGQ
ncbi:Nodulation protein D 2 [Klebsiella pneumoniae]|nr:Nodulation protein D 2 [Klebsiella pneumoniae]CAF2976562.1 Nodulation protein D 2 [Klebsiella pneumoniae]CAF3076026.1 Nodulation protein D 2 [Klebsiella pneumoniae]CAF3082393.1 Nodulation protein D 2 [Klebsiella pneumoniae]CAF9542445.1 Nodulation protein D 2 [Klebsiella pneumoniae]